MPLAFDSRTPRRTPKEPTGGRPMSPPTQPLAQPLPVLSSLGLPKSSSMPPSSRSSAAPYSPLAARFGARLRSLRLQRGMTQLEVAVEFGIDRTFISDLERGRKSVSLPFLEVFALGFGLSLSELL